MWRRIALCLALGLLVAPLPGNPARAQANPAFFDTWSEVNGGADLRITLNLLESIGWGSNRYELIRDMGERVLLLEWPTEKEADPTNVSPVAYRFVILTLSEENWYPGYWFLEYASCGMSTGLADRFDITGREGIWDQLLAPNRFCHLKDHGRTFGEGWGQDHFGRKKRENE